MVRTGRGRQCTWRAAMSSRRWLGAITSTSSGLSGVCARRFRVQQRQGAIDALRTLDVDRECVEKDVRQRMAGDLRQARVVVTDHLAAWRLVHAARADHENAFGPKVHGGRDRRRLAHRAVAEPLVMPAALELHRREDERNRRRRHQVLPADRARHRHTLRAQPGLERPGRLAEGDMVAAAVGRRRDRQRAQMAGLEHRGQAVQVHDALQQFCPAARCRAASAAARGASARWPSRCVSIVSQRAPVRTTPKASAR